MDVHWLAAFRGCASKEFPATSMRKAQSPITLPDCAVREDVLALLRMNSVSRCKLLPGGEFRPFSRARYAAGRDAMQRLRCINLVRGHAVVRLFLLALAGLFVAPATFKAVHLEMTMYRPVRRICFAASMSSKMREA